MTSKQDRRRAEMH